MRVAICGYGNLGRGVETALRQTKDLEAVGVFTRRDPKSVQTLTGIPVYPVDEIDAHRDEIDVIILCGGSATELPDMTPSLAERFNVVDSFDTHARIPEHFAAVDTAANKGGNTALISGGWDPGLFSLARLYAQS
ncbi:MAG: diaminopimelate dehydrogenase, partial [Oscillospiraceae bacterium]|nr:diaminopimelate dehydrogenase [Oscillospiraceae bacterium]